MIGLRKWVCKNHYNNDAILYLQKAKGQCNNTFLVQRWEFIKDNEKVRKQENKKSTKKAIKKTRKQEIDQESD